MANTLTRSFRGGAVTSRERITLRQYDGWEEYSMIQNLRARHPGFEARSGMARHHTTADASVETATLYQFSKGSKVELHFYRQLIDGSVQEATDNPPTVTTGVFGSDVLSAVTNALPATWGNLNDACLYGDGVRAHQINYGTATPVMAFIVFPDTTVPSIPEKGMDYSVEVADGRSSTVAVLDNLGSNEFFFVETPVIVNELLVTVSKPNGTVSTLTGQYWNGAGWVDLYQMVDNTVVSGKTLAQTGTITWSLRVPERPHYQFGDSGYWYKFKVSTILDSEVEISAVTFGGNWQDILNVWDGVLTELIEAKIYNAEQLKYSVHSTSSIDLAKFDTDDYLYLASIDRLVGMYLDPGATPNITDATVTGDGNISFFDGGTGKDYVRFTDATFLSAGFEEGRSITITNTTNNNITTKILQVTSTTIYVETGLLTAELNVSATIEITSGPLTTELDLVEVWTGEGWTSLAADLSDGTVGLTQAGFVTWSRYSAIPQPSQFQGSPFYAYWYRISFDKTLSNKVNIGVLGMPYFDATELGDGVTVGVWKGRALYSYKVYGQYLHLSAKNRPTALNGSDYSVIEVGDGRRNLIRATAQFHNEVIVWQEEKGAEGGCTTLIEGYDPSTYGKLIISSQIGILNGKCFAVVDGVLGSQETEAEVKTLVFWLSRKGLAVTDGQKVSIVSDDIRNYFDLLKRGQEDKNWLRYDSSKGVLRMGICTSGTVANIFPVFDIIDWKWSFDTYAEPLSCMVEVEAESGDTIVLQYAGGADDGYVYRVNTGLHDIVGVTPTTTAVNSYVDVELDLGMLEGILKSVGLRCKTEGNGHEPTSLDVFLNTAEDSEHTYAFDTEVLVGEGAYHKDREPMSYTANHFTIRFWRNHINVTDKLHFLDYEWSIKVGSSRE